MIIDFLIEYSLWWTLGTTFVLVILCAFLYVERSQGGRVVYICHQCEQTKDNCHCQQRRYNPRSLQ